MGPTGATLSGSFSGATGRIYEAGFEYATSEDALDGDGDKIYDDTCVGSVASGTMSSSLEGLKPSTKYYYRAFVLEYNESASSYEYRPGSVGSFITAATTSLESRWLGCYEVPSIPTLSGSSTSGTFSDRDDLWYRYYTTSSTRQVATHSFTHPTTGQRVRNYTVFYDGSRYAPLWTAHAMHSSMWPDKNAGRNESWISDPAISLTQQTGLDNASTAGYNRGHLVASNYRQSSVEQNKQTFYYSNQAPQNTSFNSGSWNGLENSVVSSIPSGSDTLYVVSGVLYEYSGSPTTKPSGSLDVPIPTHFYKCLMLCSFDSSGNMTAARGVAYLFTNEAHTGSYSSFATTIDAVEARAGFNFFPMVPAEFQNPAENGRNALSI